MGRGRGRGCMSVVGIFNLVILLFSMVMCHCQNFMHYIHVTTLHNLLLFLVILLCSCYYFDAISLVTIYRNRASVMLQT